MMEIIWLSMVAASISFTVSESKLFKPFREWVDKKCTFLGDLTSCGYCFGHWISFVLVLLYQPRLFYFWWPIDFFITALVISWLSAWQWILMCILIESSEK